MIFDNFQVEDGLSQSSVLAITQDADGFMWFGTVDGLNRFDSRIFKIYKSEAHDSTSLSSSHVNCLFVDKENQLWVGTSDGLNLYDSIKDSFSRVFLQDNSSQDNSGIRTAVYEIIQDHYGNIWVASDQGLFRLKAETILSPEKILVLAQNNQEIIEFRSLYQDRRGSIWAGTKDRIIKIVVTGNIIHQSSVSLTGPAGNADVGFVADMDELSNGNLCIATENGGVFLYDIASSTMRNIRHEMDGHGLSSNIVKTVLVDSLENLWLGTRNGLSLYNSNGEFIKNYQKDYSKKGSLSDNSIRSLYEDKNGAIWIGTFFGGINLQSKAFFPLSTYTFRENQSGLNYEVISSIYESNSGKLLIGTEGGGLNILDRALNKYETLKNEHGNVASLSLNNVKCIYQDSEGLYWIGTSGGGVNVYNEKANSIKRILYEGNDQNSGRENWIYSIVEDNKGKVWFGTFGAGLNYYDRYRDKVIDVTGPIGSTSDFRFIRTLYIDSKDRLWIGSEAGLFLYHSESNTITSYNKSTSSSLPQSTAGILCIYEDQHHLLWVGTSGEGLYKYDIKTDSFAIYNVGDGLSGDRILGILEDIESQVLWISTNNGISKFDPKALSFRNFTKEDGLLDLEFNANAYFKSNSGEMFFGGRNGLISFFPHLIIENTDVPSVIFTELRLFNKTIRVNDESGILDKQISKKLSITLEHDQNFITIDFAVLNFIKSAKNKYAYKLVGIDEIWNYVNIPTATFTNLNPGSYSLMVKGWNNDGYENTSKVELTIIVKPAMRKTWWAYSIYLFIIFTSIFILVRDQRIKAKLEHELKLEQLHLQQEENIHQLKMKFFTNISHEIRTPLTLVLTPLDKLIAEYRKDPYLFKNLIGIKNHADRLLRLVNQLLDFRRQEVGEIKLRVAKGNIIKFINEIKLSFQQLADEHQIQYTISHELDDLPLWYDRNELEKVFYNLLSNAFKFTPSGLNIRIVIEDTPVVDAEIEYLVVRIENEGKGIAPEELENIFNRFYSMDFNHVESPGMGIGLSLAKSIVETHHGKISVTSNQIDKKKWLTVFKVSFLKGKDHFHNDQINKDFLDSERLENYTGLSNIDQRIAHKYERIEHRKDKKYAVLLAEDNENIRTYIKTELENEFDILEAENGIVALDIACKEIPDLIISDVMMPELDGVQLCSILKKDERTSHIPVILLTARTSLIYKVEGLESGADDYITKPFNLEVLQLKIRNLINARNSMRSKFSNEFTLQPENLVITSPDREFLIKLKKIVEANISNPDFKIPDFSSEIGMSRPVLYRKVKALTGMTLIEFLNDYRLNKAAQILQQQRFNIAQTSSAVGFSDPNYFSKSFKRKFDVLPNQYIKDNT